MRSAALLLLALSLPVAASAQDPGSGGYGGGFGGGGYGGGRHRGAGRGGANGAVRGDQPYVAVEPAPPPADRADTLLGLDSIQALRYRADRDSLERVTQPLRDSIATQDSVVRFALGQGYREAAKDRMDLITQLIKSLHQRDDAFKHLVQGYLTHDQMKRYDQFMDREKERMPERPRERSSLGPGGR